jgi:hypothetical protein
MTALTSAPSSFETVGVSFFSLWSVVFRYKSIYPLRHTQMLVSACLLHLSRPVPVTLFCHEQTICLPLHGLQTALQNLKSGAG